MKAGSVMNLFCIFVIQLTINTYGYAYFDLGTYPDWAKHPNVTTVAPPGVNCSMF